MVINHKFKRIIVNGLIISIACLIMSIVIYYFVSQALVKNVEGSLKEIAKQGAKIVEADVKGYLDALDSISNLEQIRDDKYSIEEKLKVLEKEVKRKGLKRISIADSKGYSRTTDGNSLYIGDRDYFKRAAAGQKSVSDPILSRVDGTLVVVFAVPIYDDKQQVKAVLYTTHDVEILCKITDDIRMGKDGYSYIVNKDGDIIAHINRTIVYSEENFLQQSERDPKLAELSGLIKQMAERKLGAGEYYYEGIRKYMGFAPINGTEWSIGVTAPKSQVFENINNTLILITSLALLMLLVFLLSSFYAGYLRKRLKEEQVLSTSAIDAANILIIRLDQDGIILDINKYAEMATKYNGDEIVNKKTIFDFVPRDFQTRAHELVELLNGNNDVNNFEIPINDKYGKTIYVLWNHSKEKKMIDDCPDCVELMGVDITQRAEYEKMLMISNAELSASREELKHKYDELFFSKEQLRKSEERFRLSADGSNDILWDWDFKTNKLYFSERWYEVLGFKKEEIGCGYEEWESLLHPEDKDSIFDTIDKHINGEVPNFSCEYRLRTKSGYYKWFFARGKAQFDENCYALRMAGSLTDFTQQKEYEQSILKLAYYDVLTGLPNRSRLRERLEICIIEGREKAALLFVDIDNFKFINDSYGHSIGDRIIIEVGNRISTVLNSSDVIARQSGDEFTILLVEIHSKEDIIRKADDILKAFHECFDIEGMKINLSASIGIAVFPEDGTSFEDLSKNADTALYKAKELGKKNYVFFEKAMNDAIVERIILENNLRKAIQNEEFILHYQPQVNVISGRIVGFEALVRWISPELGFVSPARFIYAAEESGLIVPIGNWVLKTACSFIKRLVDEGNTDLKVSVNVSVIQLMQDDFVDVVSGTLEETGLDPKHLEIEITETVLMESIESNLRKLEQLRSKGLRVSLDDFGKGYSSLTYLKQLPIDTLKIDKAFVDDISNDKGLTESIVMIAHKLGLSVVAEGVETKEQLDYLAKSNCNVIQGYLISKPIPAQEVVSMINRDLII